MVRVLRSVLLLGILCIPPAVGAEGGNIAATVRVLPLETFTQDPVGSFPSRWKVRGDENEARRIYKVAAENGTHFLHALTRGQGVQIGLEHAFRPQEFPILRWRWRAKQLPSGADERAKATNDSAAAVYVIFDSRFLPRAIKYVWSTTLPVGTKIDNPVYWRAKTVVLESGLTGVGEWQEEVVNFYQDYRELFGDEPGEVQGIAVLTDSDMTQTVAEADYADFALLSVGGLAAQDTWSLLRLPSAKTLGRD
ncbi:MAG: DUF3047 domain-containing protein [Candidatus Binatia bacterium]|nr:DUF3047 domain-containing protein [Candidatus Binatia bacterium]